MRLKHLSLIGVCLTLLLCSQLSVAMCGTTGRWGCGGGSGGCSFGCNNCGPYGSSCDCADPNCGRNPCLSYSECCEAFGNIGAR